MGCLPLTQIALGAKASSISAPVSFILFAQFAAVVWLGVSQDRHAVMLAVVHCCKFANLRLKPTREFRSPGVHVYFSGQAAVCGRFIQSPPPHLTTPGSASEDNISL